MKVLISVSARITPLGANSMPRIAKRPLEVEDATHWATVKNGESFFLQEQDNKYWFVALDKKDPWRFSVAKEQHDYFMQHSTEDVNNKAIARLIEIAKLNAHYIKLLTPDLTVSRLLVYERMLKHQDTTSDVALVVNIYARGSSIHWARDAGMARSMWAAVRMSLKDALKFNPGVHSGTIVKVLPGEGTIQLLTWGTVDFLTGQHTELKWTPIPQHLAYIRSEGWHPDITPTIQLD
jgi:hypothetical protein